MTFNMIQNTWKTMNNRLEKLLEDQHSSVRTNAASSDGVEDQGVWEMLLDDILQAVDELEENRRAQWYERT